MDLDYPGSPNEWTEEIKFIIYDLDKKEENSEQVQDQIINSMLRILQNPELDEIKMSLKDVGIKTDRDFIGIGGE